jgi:hypothetical protein
VSGMQVAAIGALEALTKENVGNKDAAADAGAVNAILSAMGRLSRCLGPALDP